MKFAARDGSSARTLAVTAPGWMRDAPSDPSPAETVRSVPTRSRGSVITSGGSSDRGRVQRNPHNAPNRPSTISYARGEQIFSPGQGVGLIYIVRRGYVRLYKTLPDHRSINLGVLGPNTIFTQEDGFDGIASGSTAEALVDSTLSVVGVDDLAGLIADSPELASAVVAGMTRRMTELQTLVEQLLVRDTSVRLATTLLTLAKGFGRPTADGMVAITLPLTHQGLANMIGSNRVTVTRKLLELQEKQVVRTLGRNALAVDPDKLRGHAQTANDLD
jgi:CRP/FNR family transcriptional regulator